MLTNLPKVRGGITIFTQVPHFIPRSVSNMYQSLADVAAEIDYLISRMQSCSTADQQDWQQSTINDAPNIDEIVTPRHLIEGMAKSEVVKTGVKFLDAVLDSSYK